MSKPNRPGLTLIELLVVISILGVLTTLVAVYVLPAFSDNKNVIRGLDRVITTLLIAKQRALRDARPVGVRFEQSPDPNNPTVMVFNRMRYIQQPEIFSPAKTTPPTGINLTANSPDVTFTDNIDLIGAGTNPTEYEAQEGDWIRLISPPTNTSFNLEIVSVLGKQSARVRNAPKGSQTNGLYMLVRQPRPIPGEDIVELPQNVTLNFAYLGTFNAGEYLPPVQGGSYEIVFSPNGGLYNRPTPKPIVLCVNDHTKINPATSEPDFATARLIAIYSRTGLVAGHELNPGDPLAFALDGKNSGL